MYGILAVVGWAWTIVVAAYLIVRLMRERRRDVTAELIHEKQP
jgi:hypothetical protein